jgi:hypothetical protein
MDTEEILERLRTNIKGDETKENIKERAEEIRKYLEKEVKKGHYAEPKEIGADLNYIASIIAYTEFEKRFVEKVIQKRTTFKNSRSFENHMEQIRMKMRFLERSGKDISLKGLPREKRAEAILQILNEMKKYPEWYIDRAILDLGAYFEAISKPRTKRAEDRRQYELISRLLYDFDLFKQGSRATETAYEEEEIFLERVKKRAEAIRSEAWKDRIQGVKESLGIPS